MNTYVQIINGSHSYFGFLNIRFQDGKMKFSAAQGIKPSLKWEVNLGNISGLTSDEFMGADRVAFFDGQVEYILFEAGVGVTEFLQDNLCAEP